MSSIRVDNVPAKLGNTLDYSLQNYGHFCVANHGYGRCEGAQTLSVKGQVWPTDYDGRRPV